MADVLKFTSIDALLDAEIASRDDVASGAVACDVCGKANAQGFCHLPPPDGRIIQFCSTTCLVAVIGRGGRQE